MSRSDEFVNWVPTLIGYCVWFVLLVVFRSVVLSMRGVQELGFAVPPFTSEVYPLGLLWSQAIDAAFLTVLIISVLSLGDRFKQLLASVFPKVPRLGNVGYLGAVAGAVVIGYFAYDDFLLPPLLSQGVEWAYRLIFWVIIAGVAATAAYEVTRMILEMIKPATSLQETIKISPPKKEEPSVNVCPECGTPVQTRFIVIGVELESKMRKSKKKERACGIPGKS